jgi:hypothetical protein
MQTEPFLTSHKKLRTLLVTTGLQLLHASFENEAAIKTLLVQVTKCLDSCRECCLEAEHHLYPMAAPYEPSIVDTLQQLQRRMDLASLALSILELANASGARQRKLAGTRLTAAFEVVVFGQMQWMRSLEKGLLPVLAYYYQPQHLLHLQAGKTKEKSIPAQEATSFRKQVYMAEQELGKSFAPANPIQPAIYG